MFYESLIILNISTLNFSEGVPASVVGQNNFGNKIPFHICKCRLLSTIEKCLNNVQLHIIYALFVTKFEMQKEQTR